PQWLLLLLVIPGLYLAWKRWPPPLSVSRGRLALALRVLLIALLVLALSGVRLTGHPHQRAIVAVVDLSASVRHNVEAEGSAVRALAAGKGADDLFGMVTFGHGAAVELPPTSTPQFEVFETQPDPTQTDIGGALRLAAGIIPDGYARQLVLLTDGRENIGDAAATIAALRAEGVRVDILPVGSAAASEVLVLSVEAPPEMRVGQEASATVRIRSTGAAVARVIFSGDGREREVRDVAIPAGTSTQTFAVPAFEPGLHKVRVELADARPDTFTENNVGEAAIRVRGRPSVLVLEGTPGDANNVVTALVASGNHVDRKPSAQAPVETAILGQYESIVVVNAAADQFPVGALDAIEATVRDLGHGLVSIGGPNSYGPGGWQNTGLERALPVRMDLPPRKEKPRVAVVLMLESTENASLDPVVTGAAEAVIDKLSSEDQVAVTDNRTGFAINMQHVVDKKALDRALEGASLGDGPYLNYFKLAGDALAKTDAPLKHIVILGDGDETGGHESEYQDYLQGLRAKGITTSAIGINTHPGTGLMSNMQDLARWGGGRFYESSDTSQIPQLFLKESQVALRPWYEQEAFFPKVTAAGDLLAGVPLGAFPQLGGYVVTTPKPGAEVYFTSPKQDAVLAGWQYGLGRAVAWTSDSTGRWTANLLKDAVSGTLFSRMVTWTLPAGGGEKLQSQARVSGDSLELTVTGPEGVTGGTLQVGVLGPDLKSSTSQLPAVSPGHWQGRLPAGGVGTYLIRAVLSKNGATMAQTDLAIVVPYSAEYLEQGRDDPRLRAFARIGGKLLDRPAEAWRLDPVPVPTSSNIFWLLLALVALLWPIDIALRRLTMSRSQAVSTVQALASLRRPAEIAIEAPAELTRLRQRVAPYRRRAASPPPPVLRGTHPGHPAASEGQTEAEVAEALSARLLDARRKRRGSGD
ncbi:MAG: VWA domain-containing protein, partial [Candidatus Dormibacteraeota bacterium]|nr:VWA domain-containing protein [Candidatus Dormibacteraeota bacterium]